MAWYDAVGVVGALMVNIEFTWPGNRMLTDDAFSLCSTIAHFMDNSFFSNLSFAMRAIEHLSSSDGSAAAYASMAIACSGDALQTSPRGNVSLNSALE